VELAVKYPQVRGHRVTPQHFDRHNEGVLKQVTEKKKTGQKKG